MADQDGTWPPKILSGWKEIASYLGVEVRTAQTWERELGMPVIRLPGRIKSRISADPCELDDWRRGRNPVDTFVGKHRRRLWLWIAAGLLASGFVTGVRLWWNSPLRKPAQAVFQGQDFIVLNSEGKELWRRNFPEGLVRSFQPLIRDIDGDSHEEILMCSCEKEGSTLHCFTPNGDLKWRFRCGHPVTTRSRPLGGTYGVTDFVLFSNTNPNGPTIAVSSVHGWSHPSQVAVLDANGKLVGEYMHSGHLMNLALADIDGDGQEELLAAGVNNGHDRATLIAFDPHNVHGTSAQPADDGRQILGLGKGTEKAILYFPRVCFSQKLEPFNRVFKLEAGDPIRVYVSETLGGGTDQPYIVYELNRNLSLRGIAVSDRYQQHHRELEARGLLHHSFSAKEMEELKQITVIRKSN